ncbi:S-type pyocin domain-containing protein [Serratia oryzae]|uniref:S-type pyocin domain-containing protein n=1 Tax=Serratia oryzae TaxID=2034155 RepID=UPI001FC90AB3|nr:S-type pyocin domain-containing protein [Serratia oryzae]
MTTPAYYINGVPYEASGQVIITITNGPTSPVGNVGNSPIAPLPVYVPWQQTHGGGSIAYDPNKVVFYGLSALRDTQTKINQILALARNAYPQNAEQIRDEANALLADLITGLINHPEINTLTRALQDAINSLQINIDLKNQQERIVSIRVQETEVAFRDFMNNNKMSNFIDKSAGMIDVAISTTGPWFIDLWNKAVPPKINAEIEAKNKLVTYLDWVKTVKEDVSSKKNTLIEIKNRVEADAAAKAKAEVEARAKAEAEARAKLAALMLVAGVNPTPVYTSEMVKSAQSALTAAGRMILNRASGMLQLSTIAEGILTTTSEGAGTIAGALWRGAMELSRIATVSAVGSTVCALVVGFYPKKVGEGSDKVPGRDIEMFAAQAQLFAAGKVNIQPEMTSVNLPVRGLLVTENGRQYVSLVKTGVNGVSANVPVLRAVRDEKTGLDKITLPAVGGVPTRTVLINPVPTGPAAPPHTGNSSPVPVTPVHTGTEIKQVASIVTTTYPADDLQGLQDFIYWQPDAAGTGVEPIYVMLSEPLDSGRFTRKQLDKKFKHAIDFGINDTKKNSETLTKYRDAIEAHLADTGTVERGTYRREKGSKVYFNPKTMNVVILKADEKFLSGWKINPDADNGRIYLETGDL